MIEVKLLKLYKKKKKLENKKKVKKEAWIFQRIIFIGIVLEKKVTVKNFGTFEVKKFKPRKIYDFQKIFYI